MTLAVTVTRACLVSRGKGLKPHRAFGCQQGHKCLGACEWVDRNLMGKKPTNPHTGNLYALKKNAGLRVIAACERPPSHHMPSSSVASLFLTVLLAVPAVICSALSLVSVGFSRLFLSPCFSSSVLASGRIQTRKTASQDSRCSSPSPLISFGFPMA